MEVLESIFPFLIFGGVVLLVVFLLYLSWLQEKKRREAMLVVAGSIPGHEIEHPMAIVILGGLVTATLVNLFVLP